MKYTFKQISTILHAEALHVAEPEKSVDVLAFDSRLIHFAAETLFFCITSANANGHLYLKECFLKGVRQFVIEDRKSLEVFSDEELAELNVLQAISSVEALQKLAAKHRKNFEVPVIGITGSNGKTIVKEWLYSLLSPEMAVIRSPKSFNSQIGVPLSVWQLNENYDLAIFEAGISQTGEMQKLEEIIQPNFGIFTNIGEAHGANFSSIESKINEKLRLFKNVKKIIYPADFQLIQQQISQEKQKGFFNKNIELFTYSETDKNADLYIEKRVKFSNSTVLTAVWKKQKIELNIAFADEASVQNAIICWLCLLVMDIPQETINERFTRIHTVEMRLELLQGVNGITLINDTYNSDLESFRIALDTLGQQKQHKNKTVILSDILESGRPNEILYREVAKLLENKQIQRFIGIGPKLCSFKKLFANNAVFFTDTIHFISAFNFSVLNNEAVLVKGARKFGFEVITKRLQHKSHQTVLEIDLNALAHNLNAYRSLLKPGTKIMAMVKAFSYGSGSYEIANILQFRKADYLAVAYADEGVQLRQHGITLPIMIMNTEESGFEDLIINRLEPEIFSFAILESFYKFLENHYIENEPYPIHIKIDTGMNRLGFEPKDAQQIAEKFQAFPMIKVQSIFSHFAAADMPEHDDFTQKQANDFLQVCNFLEHELGYTFIKHIHNSSGIVRFPEYQLNMVRLGLGLYGIDPSTQIQNLLENVSTLKTHISQIKIVAPGQSVGYARKGISEVERKIATLGIGYADGFSRSLSNGKGKVLINGKLAPVIGNVCMDMTMVDVTGTDAKEGDEAIIFGKDLPITTVAIAMNTIPYEVLTNVSARVKRVYYSV